MNELIIYELARKIALIVLTILGSILFILRFAVWLTNGTIIDRVKPKVIHDTIYLPKKNIDETQLNKN